MTTATTTPAFAACEALFDANPDHVTDEGDAGATREEAKIAAGAGDHLSK